MSVYYDESTTHLVVAITTEVEKRRRCFMMHVHALESYVPPAEALSMFVGALEHPRNSFASMLCNFMEKQQLAFIMLLPFDEDLVHRNYDQVFMHDLAALYKQAIDIMYFTMSARQLSMLLHYASESGATHRQLLKQANDMTTERKSAACRFFAKYKASVMLKYVTDTPTKDGSFVFKPWHHFIITRDKRFVVFVWDTRKVVCVGDIDNLQDGAIKANKVDNFADLDGYVPGGVRISDYK